MHVLESLYFKVTPTLWYKDIGPWIRTALHHHHCHLRELEIVVGIVHTLLPPELFTCKTLVVLKLKGIAIDVEPALTTVCLPSLRTLHLGHSGPFVFGSLQLLLSSCNSLTDLMVIRDSSEKFWEYDVSWCKTLVALKLKGLDDMIINSSSSAVCLPFLKTLHLIRVVNFQEDSFSGLLSNCPVLSDLTLEEKTGNVMLNFDIAMPFLQRLSIVTNGEDSTHLCTLLNDYIGKLAIIAPSFEYFNIRMLARFYMRVKLGHPSELEDASSFSRIAHLELSMCSSKYGERLVDLLQRSIKLVVLKLKNVSKAIPLESWEPPSSVPECLVSSLEALEWRGYTGRRGDKNLLSYLLNHALCLKTAEIITESSYGDKQHILEDLASMPRGSKSCELVLK